LQCPSNAKKTALAAGRLTYQWEPHYGLVDTFIGGNYWGASNHYGKITQVKNPSGKLAFADVTGLNANYGGSHFMYQAKFASESGAARAFDDIRHGGAANVIFCDGHVAKVSGLEAKQVPYPTYLYAKYSKLWGGL
jgi:prepilin-type processing-associated H-X9-DG protein